MAFLSLCNFQQAWGTSEDRQAGVRLRTALQRGCGGG